jgi:Ubiquitin carboxyl-terminal hydrolase
VTLQQIFDEMKYPPSRRTTSSLRSFCQTLGINPWEQQDAQEFWKLLLPELGYEPLLALYRGTYDTFIQAMDGSGRERIRKEIFMDLSIDVADYDHVMDSLRDMFTEGEVLKVQEGNGWRPDKESEEKVDAIKGNRLIVRGLPKILQLHLKRFRHDWETGRVSKMNDRFVFEEVLDLQSVFIGGGGGGGVDDKEECLYDLQSVVVHVGEYGSGHYYAYVRPNVQTNEWYRFDDDRVTRVSFQDVIEDAFGGHVVKQNAKHDTCQTTRWEKKKGKEGKNAGFWNIHVWWKRVVRVGGGGDETRSKRSGLLEYGWGGRMSSAYMLQYVKRSEISLLYHDEQD